MPVASSTGWVGSRVTPAPGHVQGWSLAPPQPSLHRGSPALVPVPAHRGAGEQLVPPASPLAASLAAHAVMWQGTTTTRANWLM